MERGVGSSRQDLASVRRRREAERRRSLVVSGPRWAVSGSGMLLWLKGKERTVWRGQMCANRVRGGGSPECVAGDDAPAQNSEGKSLPVVEMGKTSSGNRGRWRCPRARTRGVEEGSQRKGRR
jgi:hypothetical protein